ncbi:hypothetical protein NLJ89_g10459 [Agrocybe chaxingu]|uniref:C2H2-type domain-containing protein n=1 Tax=Agrocybe chaxingu TaxID=84603 RepID=A0A9W8JRP5_9AGAR|nr:hypothetical protein NLJ89_g10459 [Agrocybe chaxingu]
MRALASGGYQGGSEANTFPAPGRPSRKVKRYPCDICGQIFTRSGDVRRHKESRHTDGTGGCRCPYCDRVLTRQDALQRHWDKYCRKKSKRHVSLPGPPIGSTFSITTSAMMGASSMGRDDDSDKDSARGESDGDMALGGSSGIDVGMRNRFGGMVRRGDSSVNGHGYDDSSEDEYDQLQSDEEESRRSSAPARSRGSVGVGGSGPQSYASLSGVQTAVAPPYQNPMQNVYTHINYGITDLPGSYTTHPHPGPRHRASRGARVKPIDVEVADK